MKPRCCICTPGCAGVDADLDGGVACMVECAPCLHGCPAPADVGCCRDELVPVLSLWEPWASAVGRTKWIETRSWAPRLLAGSDVFIAAAAARKPLRDIAIAAPHLLDELTGAGVAAHDLPFGHLVSRVCLVDAVPTEYVWHNDALGPRWRFVDGGRVEIPTRELRWGDYTPGRWAWLFDNDVHHFDPPVPFKGGQGLTKRVSLAQLEEATTGGR